MGRQRARTARAGLRAARRGGVGGVPLLVPMLLVFLGTIWLASRLGKSADARGIAVIDTRRFKLHSGAQWLGATWRDQIQGVLAARSELSVNDTRGIAALTTELAALSFVAEVGAPEVVWPDGVTLPLLLHAPVACIGTGSEFLAVAEDGTILSGYSRVPPEAHGGWLPVIGPNNGTLNHLRPGDVLGDERDLAALNVAVSMWNHLSPEHLHALGRIEIDATPRRAPDGFPGGVLIDLENSRRILFGRPPGTGHPGELPEDVKWRNVEVGLDLFAAGEPWALLDARWDVPDTIFAPGAEIAQQR